MESNGLSYPEGEKASVLLPRSDVSVFAYGDIHRSKILVKQDVDRGSGVPIAALRAVPRLLKVAQHGDTLDRRSTLRR